MSMTRVTSARAAGIIASLLLAVSLPAAGAAGELRLERLLPHERLNRPVHVAEIPDGSGRMVVVEQPGRIRYFAPGAKVTQGLLLDIRRRVSTGGWEEGLLSIAFHPRFRDNGYYYVYYSAAWARRSVISRFTATPARTATGRGSERVLLEVEQPFANHNGGQLAFGPDGYLYIGLGDGGSGGDPHRNGQNPRTLLGSILRIDVDREGPGRAYAIPPDNPFAGGTLGRRPEIWAYGLRNPWRFSFDRLTGELYAADVGQNAVEEIDLIAKGANYGWNVMEGTRCYEPSRGCARVGLTPPIAEYGHGRGQSITGGYVYRGSALPGLRGRYVFGDFSSGSIWSVPAGAGSVRKPRLLLQTKLAISSFGEDRSGELYLTDLNGYIFKLTAGR